MSYAELRMSMQPSGSQDARDASTAQVGNGTAVLQRGWQGNYKGKDRKPTCRLEVICDDYLYICHACFGSPCSKNDRSIMNNPDLFNAIRVGKWPPCRPDCTIAGKRVNWFYYLEDGIYPRFEIFVCTISSPKNLKEKVFPKHQESVRKSVERDLGFCSSDFIFSIGLHVFGIRTIWLL
jgi:hypothetical protein